MKNKNLTKAKEVKNNEFYTRLEDIEQELIHYTKHFKDKIVYCNCDSEKSNFFKYFYNNFNKLNLKKLIISYKDDNNPSYKIEVFKENNELKTIKTKLNQNGDFRSNECVELLKQSDIIVTNPPFSLFKDLIDVLFEHNKKFLILGAITAIGYKNIFPLFLNNEIWLGCNQPKIFIQPDNTIKKFGNIYWFTNLKHNKINDYLKLEKEYNEKNYPKYDNYDAIHIDRLKNIPKDYYGAMGVPLTFMCKYNPNQFEIIRFRKGYDEKDLRVDGKDKFTRIIIKRKDNEIHEKLLKDAKEYLDNTHIDKFKKDLLECGLNTINLTSNPIYKNQNQ